MPASRPPRPPRASLARLLPADVDLATPPRHPAARDVWLGAVWSRLGRGDRAWAWWDRVVEPGLHPWVAAERGRVLRELGLHGRAEELERAALAAATDPVDRAMLHVSLAADAVGLGDAGEAQARLAVAEDAIADLPEGPRAARQRLRLTWVRTEVAWVSGRRPPDHGLPRWRGAGTLDMPADLAHGTSFHRAKALLFGGLVVRSLPMLDLAAASAPPVLSWAVHLARADAGADGAAAAAAVAWRAVVPPPPHTDEVAATPTARRLAAAG